VSVTWARQATTTAATADSWDRIRRGRVRIVLAATITVSLATGAAWHAAHAGSAAPLPDLSSVEQVIGAQQAWQAGATGQGIDVALVDTGVAPVQGLTDGKVLYGPDLSFDSQDPQRAFVDNYGHGTAMAGIIAGNDGVAGGYAGVAPNARLVSVKVGARDGAVDVSQIIAGIDWVVQHAHDNGMNIRVLNLSLGTSSTQYYVQDPLAHAAENAWRHGIAVVVAAGNDGSSMNSLADPATDPFLIAVGAEDPVGTVGSNDDIVPSYSSRGTGNRHADVVAPGSYVMGLLAPGSALAQQFPNAVLGGRFLRGSGTSQAAAVASGVVADVLSAHPGWTPDQVKQALTQTATRIATNNPNGLVSLPGAVAATPGVATQTFQRSTGGGSLESARGNTHIAYNGVVLTGEQDVFGNAWSPSSMAPAEESLTAWSGGNYNGAAWTGSGWTPSDTLSVTWSSVTWSSVTWSSVTWSSVTWSSVTWSSVTWSSVTWSSVTWSSVTWSSTLFASSAWLGSSWI
jgi:serine protease AprX